MCWTLDSQLMTPFGRERRLCEWGAVWKKYVTRGWILKFRRVALLPAVCPRSCNVRSGLHVLSPRLPCHGALSPSGTLSQVNTSPWVVWDWVFYHGSIRENTDWLPAHRVSSMDSLDAFSSPFPIAEASSPLQSCLWEAKVTQRPGETCPQPLLSLGLSLV